ncbi:exported hypothetical protein [Candidatus Terasakiella magnetica]|uniref:Solute-binding protein family 3/N-terminal domain-containing protein n=1 Tax=Candidatus Terasakiella magnetica TaxID=1867952 RepID=A0A1C3RCU6_9PROT|nr:hypothetical protein [Candidatus Terasakiella magnetica]SCA55058.1 exported hypothetical protein [Candidatus Terasakiella magnetica]
MNKNFIVLHIIVVLTLLICSNGSRADSEYYADLSIPLVEEISLNLDKKFDGYHGKIVKQILDQYPDKISFNLTSPKHAYEAFYKGRYSCVTPDSKSYYDLPNDFVDSTALSSVDWVIVQRKGTKPILSKKDLIGLSVGSFYAPEEIASIVPQEGVVYDVIPNHSTILRKVAARRNDIAILPQVGLTKLIAKREELKDLTFEISPKIATVAEAIMCHDTKRGREIIKLVNQGLKAINKKQP